VEWKCGGKNESLKTTICSEKTMDEELENVEYFKNLGSMITNDASCRTEIKSLIKVAKAAFNKQKTVFTSKLDLQTRN
jgi:hypothetical protein